MLWTVPTLAASTIESTHQLLVLPTPHIIPSKHSLANKSPAASQSITVSPAKENKSIRLSHRKLVKNTAAHNSKHNITSHTKKYQRTLPKPTTITYAKPRYKVAINASLPDKTTTAANTQATAKDIDTKNSINTIDNTNKKAHPIPVSIPSHSIIRVNDCLLVATIYSGNWNVECIRTGSTDKESWDKSTWRVAPMTKTVVPKDVWPVCSWLNGFGYNQLISTPDLDLDRRLGEISRRRNIFMYHHGYEVSGGMTIISRLGRYCPAYGKNVHIAAKKTKDWMDYISL
jgi:hypothetical protein